MQFHFSRTPVRQTKDRPRRLRGMALLAALFLTLISLSHLGAMPAFAIPPEPIGEPRDNDPYVPPSGGFDWSRPSRVALAFAAWTPDTFNPFVPGHYDQSYINPTSFGVRLDGCTTAAEERTGSSDNTYAWTLKGATRTDHHCRFVDSFPTQGTFPVSLKVTKSDGTVVLDTVTENVVIKDLFIVALGDSYASGEGNPDVPQVLGAGAGGELAAVVPAVWWDARCHRSMLAPSAQAAWALEKANPQISVTYINFACSGATINRFYDNGESALEPYRLPGSGALAIGQGILGPYAGAVPPDKNHPDQNQIPSQINQLTSALTMNGPARPIDALIMDGGGNDMGFGLVAGLCTLYYQCPDHLVDTIYICNITCQVPLKQQVQHDISWLASRYAALKTALDNTHLPIAHTYLTEYPDPTRRDDGQFCDKILDDVIPAWMSPLLAGLALANWTTPPLPPYQIDRDNLSSHDEIAWAGSVVLKGLDDAVIAAAPANGWTLIDGIADNVGSPFVGHGYCASDNWIRTATEAMLLEGPVQTLPPGTSVTLGTLHPTARGYQAMASRMLAKLLPDLFPGPVPTPPTFNAPDFSQSVKGANGWLTGHVSGVSCPAGAANCALEQQALSVDASTSIAGTGLSVNGVAANCPSTPTLINGVICSMQMPNAQNVGWSFAFPNDGIYRLEFSVSARNGATGSFSQEVKVDLNNPTASSSLSSAAPASGWFTTPVTPTLSGTDGTGSGIQNVQYTLDGGSQQTVNGNSVSVQLATDGTHTFSYQVKDFAGRQSGAQSLTVKLDQTAPVVTCGTPDGLWHANDVSISCSANDNGGSGVSTTDANFTLMTSVAANTETNNAATGNRTVCDIAGNCAQQTGPINANKVDKKAPAITLTNPVSTSYLLNQSVAASYTCADGGSGVATCAGPVANNAAIDTTSLGSKTFTVTAADAVGNTSSKGVTYLVGYNVCVLFDQTKSYKVGSTVPIKLQLCNVQNANLSSANVLPVAIGLTQKDSTASTDVADSGSANPDNAFRFDATLNAYIYNLSTKGLATGTWALNFTIPGDPTSHSVQFDVR